MAEQTDRPPPVRPARTPRLSSADLLLQVWRAKWIVLLVAAPIWIAGILIGLNTQPVFTSTARLYVELPAGAARDAVMDQEVALLRSPSVIEATVSRFPLDRLDPALARARDRAISQASGAAAEAIDQRFTARSLARFDQRTQVRSPGASQMIDVAVSHPQPAFAAEALNAWLAAYLNQRDALHDTPETEAARSPRKAAERAVLAAEDAMHDFLRTHELSDYAQARDAAIGLQSALRAELSSVRAAAAAAEARTTRIIAQMQETAPQDVLFVEDASGDTLLSLRLQRAQLLSRYTEDSQAVQVLDREIAAVETLLAETERPPGRVRRGPNPAYTALEADLHRAEADAAALARQRATLQSQLGQVDATLASLTALAPDWARLQRQHEAARQALAAVPVTGAGDAGTRAQVRILEGARLPVFATGPRNTIIALAIGLGLLAGLVAGVIRAVTRPGFATASSLALTTGLPVLATVRGG